MPNEGRIVDHESDTNIVQNGDADGWSRFSDTLWDTCRDIR